MSFRRRFGLILGLVVAMVAMAGLALNQLRADRDEQLEATAVAEADGLVGALVAQATHDPGAMAALRARPTELGPRGPCPGPGCGGPPNGPPPLPPGIDRGPPPFFPGPPPSDFDRGPPPLDDALGGPDGPGPRENDDDEPATDPLSVRVDELLSGVPRSGGGYCRHDGSVLLGRASKSGNAPRRLRMADLDLARSTCAKAVAGEARHEHRAMPDETLFVSARVLDGDLTAWSLTRLSRRPSNPRSGGLVALVGGMTLVCLLLVGLTLDGWRTLRGGTGDLEEALVRLRADLRSTVVLPRAVELARVAEGLRAMATDLADTQSRERTLERQLGHEQRLAGLGRVVAGVAHEVRNPITGIKLKLDGLVRRGVDDRARDDIRVCLDEIARLDRVVTSLLMVARRASDERESIKLGELLDARIAQADALATDRHVRVERRGDADVVANREALTAVVDNLLRNALEASPDGGIVEVVIESRDARLHLLVCDRGEGIPESRHVELFEPFFTMKPTGTGLGLFLSRSLVVGQGGDVTYRRADAVTTFDVELP